MDEFEKAVSTAINCHSRENASNTPDYILAAFMADALAAFDTAVRQRETWYGRDDTRRVVGDTTLADAERWRKLVRLCGYVQNGTETTVKLFQDDATRDCFVKVGEISGFYAKSFAGALDSIPEPD